MQKPETTIEEGIWSGIPMPWDDDERLNKSALQQLVRRCAQNESDGIYVAGTTGEFHAMSMQQFADVVETFMEEISRHPVCGHQVGCGAFSQALALEKINIAKRNGCSVIQMNLPGWLPLNDDEVIAFYATIAERNPELAICVYDNKASGRVIGEDLWPRLLKAVPAIKGAKFTYEGQSLLPRIREVDPGFKYFATEGTFRPMSRLGISGVTAWISYCVPAIIRDQWNAVRNQDWEAFAAAEKRLDILHDIKAEVRPKGYRAGIIDRLMGLASGFLTPEFHHVLRPWRSVDPADVAHVRSRMGAELGEDCLFRETG